MNHERVRRRPCETRKQTNSLNEGNPRVFLTAATHGWGRPQGIGATKYQDYRYINDVMGKRMGREGIETLKRGANGNLASSTRGRTATHRLHGVQARLLQLFNVRCIDS